MVTVRFQTYPATTSVTFACPSCGKKRRKRTFRAECTVNPFNRKEDGTVRSPAEVRVQSREKVEAEREEFMRRPLCATCENSLTWNERREIHRERRTA